MLVEPTLDADEEDEDIPGRRPKKRKKRQTGPGNAKRRRVLHTEAAPAPQDTSRLDSLIPMATQVEPTQSEERSGPQDTSSQDTLVPDDGLEGESQEGLTQDDHAPVVSHEAISQGDSAQAEMDEDDDEVEANVSDPVATSQGNGNDSPGSVDFEALWEEYFAWWDQQSSSKSNRVPGIEPALRDLIKGISSTLKCRRIPWKVFFSRTKELGKLSKLIILMDPSLLTRKSIASILTNCGLPTPICRPPNEGPCIRCQPPPSQFCCDKDTPELLNRLPEVEPRTFPKRPSRSKIPAKSYMPGPKEAELTAALEAWRDRAAVQWLSPEHRDLHGGAAVMSNKVLKSIVKYASVGKIKSIENLRRETQWSRSNRYGAEVLDLIKDLLPHHFDDSARLDNVGPVPLGDSTSRLNDGGVNLVSSFNCCEACCMISDRVQCGLNSVIDAHCYEGDHATSFHIIH